jgi:hypothetical protein
MEPAMKKVLRACAATAAILSASAAALAAPQVLNNCRTLNEPGAYVVGRNLNANGDCFVIAADYVNVDLDGFVVSGNGTGSGFVEQLAVGRRGFSVRNGVVTGFANGLFMGNSSAMVIDRMHFTANSAAGVRAGNMVTVSNSMFLNNGTGLALDQRANVTGNTVNDNTAGGISVGIGGTVIGNAVGRNGGNGISLSEGGLVANTVSRNNANHGVMMDCPGTVVASTVSNNLGFNVTQPGLGSQCNEGGTCCLVIGHTSTINSF